MIVMLPAWRWGLKTSPMLVSLLSWRPASTREAISSTKRIWRRWRTSASTAASAPSHWPMYLLLARSDDPVTDQTSRPCSAVGQCLSRIRCTTSCTMAVLPTPDGPISTRHGRALSSALRTPVTSDSRRCAWASADAEVSAVNSMPTWSSLEGAPSVFSGMASRGSLNANLTSSSSIVSSWSAWYSRMSSTGQC